MSEEIKQYTVMAINPGHNGAVALVINGDLVYYSEEERHSRMKYDGNPFRAMLPPLYSVPIDEIVIGGTISEFPQLPWTRENPYAALARKFNPNIKITIMSDRHHLTHAASGFYGSGFTSAAVIVVDGAGSSSVEQNSAGENIGGFETESIYQASYPANFQEIYKRFSDGHSQYLNTGVHEYDNSVTITKAYEAVTYYLGFGFLEAGKTMGLSPYGQEDSNIPPFFVEGKGNKNLLMPMYPAGALIDENRFPYLERITEPKEWHNDFSLVREQDKNLAYHVQKETEEQVIRLIKRAIEITGETNIVLSGGYALNCVANYKFVEHFPDCKFYIDPLAHDGGTTIGMCKYAWHTLTGSSEVKPLTSVYLGHPPDYNNLEMIEKQLGEKICVTDTSAAEVANLLNDGKIIALFQGRAEGGPRALGNRSILFDPRRDDGKDYVNSVKHREWFRPFAGTVLHEHANDYFEMLNIEESPFMMYAVKVKTDQLPAITHVDNTCRIQTVKKSQNEKYYELIEEFNKLTGIPVVFNTSLNLAGHPLAETLVDAVNTLINSGIDCLYLPDINKLIKKCDGNCSCA